MTTLNLKVGDKVTYVSCNAISYITSITEKRINMDSNSPSSSSTGRVSSKFYMGHKNFIKEVNAGIYKIN